jgi:DNA mismatch repair protein MutS
MKNEQQADQSISDYYFDVHCDYIKKYGPKTLILMEVGSFYEAYATDTMGCDMITISRILNINYTKKDKKKPIDRKNPYLLGFPSPALSKFLRLLINEEYTVVRMNQFGPKNAMIRKVTQIYSPGTYVDDSLTNESNNILSIFIEELKNGTEIEYCIGLSIIDLSTGECSLYETYSNTNDSKFPLDELTRIINSYKPSEVIINRLGTTLTKENLLAYLELYKNIHYCDNIPKIKFSKTYINNFLSKIYKDHGNTSVLDYLNISLLGYATASFIFALEFAFEHNEVLIESMCKPVILQNDNNLILGNNAIFQLNVTQGDSHEGQENKNSLYDIINQTSTFVGKRFLKKELINPIVSPVELTKRYNFIDNLITDNVYITIETHLKNICDIERLGRKLSLKKLNPYEFANFYASYEHIIEMIGYIKTNKKISGLLPTKKILTDLNSFIVDVKKELNIEEMKKYNLDDIKTNIFIKGTHPEIDKFQEQIDGNVTNINEIATVISSKFENTKHQSMKVMSNEKEGYHFQITKAKLTQFETIIEKGVTVNSKLYTKDMFKFKTLGSVVKVYFSGISTFNNTEVSDIQEKLTLLIRTKCIESYDKMYMKYKFLFGTIVNFIARIDFYKSGAKVAKLYNYCKPLVKTQENSFVSCTGLRHPIIERIRTNVEYVPHDIELGLKVLNGMLIYGLNSSGKSSLMKSIGLSVILAQIGYYVPAKTYSYSPYKSLFARITGNDNIFKGLSSFALEMTELKAILNRTGPNTLVIGDEVCRGTEHISGNAIVASSIIKLASTKCSFIFATHLHEIASMTRIKELKNVKAYHLTVEYDEKKDTLVYDRILKEGSGEPIYGYIVAKYIIQDLDFMKNVQDIKNELLNKPNVVIYDKKSKYNSEVLMTACQVCKKSYSNKTVGKNVGHLDTHHINFQSECKNGFVKKKGHVMMNSKSNLVVLCKECHYAVHHNKLTIRGYKDDIKGAILDYSYIEA